MLKYQAAKRKRKSMREYEDFIAEESRAYLDKVRTLKKRIDECDQMIEVIRYLAEPKGIDYASQPGSGLNKDAIADVVAAMDELTGRWRDERLRLDAELDEALGIIYKLEGRESTLCALLMYRYVSAMDWADVAEAMNYSEDYCYKLHRAALVAVHRFIPPMYRTDIPKAEQ